MKCSMDFDDLPDSAVIIIGKVLGPVTYDTEKFEENSRSTIPIKKQTVGDVKKIIAEKDPDVCSEIEIEAITF